MNDDQVTSQKIREADGSSGQDTNSGSGVKTGHIQDGAVTDAKIAGPISASKISSAGLNADTVDGLHGADLAHAVHTHPQSQVTGLEGALAGKSDVTHNHDVLYQQKYGKVAVVAQTGGDYTDPISAMNALAVWCGTPSASNACLVKIMPGVYGVGGNSLQMQEYVDVEGSGENTTRISGCNSSGVVRGASNAEMRFFSAVSECSGRSVAVYNQNTSPKMTNITAIATSGSSSEDSIGVASVSASPIMTNVTVSASGGNYAFGIHNDTGSPIITNINATTGGCSSYYYCAGIKNDGGSPVIMGGVITSTTGVWNGNGANARLSNLVIDTTAPYTGFTGVWNRGNSKATVSNVVIESRWGCVTVEDTSVIKVDRSSLSGGFYPLASFWGGGSIFVADSKVEWGQALSVNTSVKCINLHDGNYDAVTCP